jgi:Mg/Co/Ni transporter MgtE
MREPTILARLGDATEDISKQLEEKESNFCYVADAQGELKGYVEYETILEQKGKIIDGFVIKNHEAIDRNAFVYETFAKLEESDYDVAVIDKKNKIRGVVSYEDVVSALTH